MSVFKLGTIALLNSAENVVTAALLTSHGLSCFPHVFGFHLSLWAVHLSMDTWIVSAFQLLWMKFLSMSVLFNKYVMNSFLTSIKGGEAFEGLGGFGCPVFKLLPSHAAALTKTCIFKLGRARKDNRDKHGPRVWSWHKCGVYQGERNFDVEMSDWMSVNEWQCQRRLLYLVNSQLAWILSDETGLEK